jgi:hypothetical protein
VVVRGSAFVAGQEEGLPPVGVVRDVVASPQLPMVAWATIEAPATGRTLWATSDGGRTWTRRSELGSASPALLATHPTATTELYGVTDGRVLRSSDGGASFGATSLSGSVTQLSVVPGGGGVLMAAALAGERSLAASADGGRSWTRRATPVAPVSVARGPVELDRFAVADSQRVVVLGARPQRELSTPGGAPRLVGLTAPTPAGYYVRGLREGAVLQAALSFFNQPLSPTDLRNALRPVRLLPRGAVTQFPSTLAPVKQQVSVPAGGRVRLPYTLVVPRTPRPVDVMFLLDSTNSMAEVFDDLRQGVAAVMNALNAAGLDSRMGLADFRDYPAPYGRAGETDWPYRLDQRLTSISSDLEGALGGVETGGGTDDGGDSALTAVVQSTTGEGESAGLRVLVPRGRQAGYRANALKLAVLAYDTTAHEAGQPLPSGGRNRGPTFDSAIATAHAHGVHVMGLSISQLPRLQLRRLASGTGTVAPEGGVDCDANGSVELPAGEPLVCLIEPLVADSPVVVVGGPSVPGVTGLASQPLGVAPAVVQMAAGIPDLQTVELGLSEDPVVRLATAARSRVDVRADNALDYVLDVRCPRGPASRHPVALTARGATGVLASARLQVDCGGIGAPPAAVLPPVAAAVAPAAPANGVPNANPNPNPNANPQTAPNLNTNAGFAQDEQEQNQLALAEGDRPTEQLEMSAARSSAFVGTAALLLCAATAVAWRRREQEQLQT